MIDNGNKIIKVNVEVADDINEQMQGLMFREKLDENAGMIFVFDEESYLGFWMKNTLIPLDIIFINRDFEIVDIKYAVPCKNDPCKNYVTIKPAEYVLEVNGNFTAHNYVKTGDKVVLKLSNTNLQ